VVVQVVHNTKTEGSPRLHSASSWPHPFAQSRCLYLTGTKALELGGLPKDLRCLSEIEEKLLRERDWVV
jgi:hypothetical protein